MHPEVNRLIAKLLVSGVISYLLCYFLQWRAKQLGTSLKFITVVFLISLALWVAHTQMNGVLHSQIAWIIGYTLPISIGLLLGFMLFALKQVWRD